MARQVSMKLLCVSTRKSVRAVVHAPAPTVVGMRYSREVSRVIEGSRCLSSTLRRAVLCEEGREGMSVERREGGRGDECGEKGCECMGAIFTVVPQFVSHQLPGFLQTLHHLLILPTNILCTKQNGKLQQLSFRQCFNCPQLLEYGLLQAHRACGPEGTLQWSSFSPPFGPVGDGNCHRDTVAVVQCLVGTV